MAFCAPESSAQDLSLDTPFPGLFREHWGHPLVHLAMGEALLDHLQEQVVFVQRSDRSTLPLFADPHPNLSLQLLIKLGSLVCKNLTSSSSLSWPEVKNHLGDAFAAEFSTYFSLPHCFTERASNLYDLTRTFSAGRAIFRGSSSLLSGPYERVSLGSDNKEQFLMMLFSTIIPAVEYLHGEYCVHAASFSLRIYAEFCYANLFYRAFSALSVMSGENYKRYSDAFFVVKKLILARAFAEHSPDLRKNIPILREAIRDFVERINNKNQELWAQPRMRLSKGVEMLMHDPARAAHAISLSSYTTNAVCGAIGRAFLEMCNRHACLLIESFETAGLDVSIESLNLFMPLADSAADTSLSAELGRVVANLYAGGQVLQVGFERRFCAIWKGLPYERDIVAMPSFNMGGLARNPMTCVSPTGSMAIEFFSLPSHRDPEFDPESSVAQFLEPMRLAGMYVRGKLMPIHNNLNSLKCFVFAWMTYSFLRIFAANLLQLSPIYDQALKYHDELMRKLVEAGGSPALLCARARLLQDVAMHAGVVLGLYDVAELKKAAAANLTVGVANLAPPVSGTIASRSIVAHSATFWRSALSPTMQAKLLDWLRMCTRRGLPAELAESCAWRAGARHEKYLFCIVDTSRVPGETVESLMLEIAKHHQICLRPMTIDWARTEATQTVNYEDKMIFRVNAIKLVQRLSAKDYLDPPLTLGDCYAGSDDYLASANLKRGLV